MALEKLGFTVTERLYANSRTLISRAIRQSDGSPVIIKSLVDPHPSASQLARFAYACKIQQEFDHPGITRVLDCVEAGSAPIMVLEDIGAIPLTRYMQELPGQSLSVERFLSVAIQLSHALAEIHHRHVIHKDLHPGNILMQPRSGQVQITDFDISSRLSREQPSLQPPEELEGILGFISPEQTGRMNRALDYRSDFYSLGVTFYWLLTGRMPFAEDSAIAMVHAHIARVALPVNKVRPELPAMLAKIIDRMMAKNAEARYQSAAGLTFDLEECQRQWQVTHSIQDFTLAAHDISDRFQVSQKLYGREPEIAQLINAFAQALQGNPQLMTVAGYAGIGKSALVHEAHKPIAAYGGWFISGKFDQFKHNVPYSALHEALKTWVQLILSEGDEALSRRRSTLLEALGANARVLIDFQPDLEILLGSLLPVPELGPLETQNRFHIVIQQFIQVLTNEQPLVLFLDDLQWADMGTLGLLKVLMHDIGHQLLLIVAYRDNEVTETHPTMLTLQAIQQDLHAGPERFHYLNLLPLTLQDVEHLLVDSLHCIQDIEPLARLIQKKTAGNPFFINEFLRALYSDGLINFNRQVQKWQWDIERIESQDITDNVVDLMLAKMRRLPPETQHLLQLASCIGGRFDLATLALITHQPLPIARSQLWPALREGLLIQEAGDWFSQSTEEPPASSQFTSLPHSQKPVCRFLHDRMLQAAYDSLAEIERIRTHLSIGRILQQNRSTGQAHEVFTITEHLNQARRLLKNPDQRLELAQLNLEAAQLAQNASAWSASARHARVARELLTVDHWQHQYALSAQLFTLSVQSESLDSDFESAEQLAQIALRELHSDLEKARICLILLNSNIARGKREYAIEVGIQGLKFCGIDIPALEQLDEAYRQEQAQLNQLAAQQPLAQQLHVIHTVPTFTTLASGLLSALLLASFVFGKRMLNMFIGCRGMRFLLEHGLCEETASLLCEYAVIQLREDNYREAFELGSMAMEFVSGATNPSSCLQTYLYSGSAVWLYFRPFQDATDLLWKGYHAGMEYGDLNIGMGCFSNIIINRFAKGDSLAEIDLHIQQLEELMGRYRLHVSAGRHYKRLSTMLQQQETKDLLEDDAFSVQELQIINSSTLRAFIDHLRLQWYFWSEQHDSALNQLTVAEKSLELIPCMAPNIDHYLIEAMLLSRCLEQTADKGALLERLLWIERYFAVKEAFCEANFGHKQMLVAALIAAARSQTIVAIEHYRKAIASASEEGFIQFQALGQELLGRYLWQLGWTEFATPALQEAHYFYGRWGCVVKQKLLLQEFPALLGPLSGSRPTREGPTPSATSPGLNASLQLDLESIMKSTQAISGELVLEHLLNKILHIILENAGAQTAAIVMFHDGKLTLEACLQVDQPEKEGGNLKPNTAITDSELLPLELLRYALHTDKPLLLQDVQAHTSWSQDPYVSRHKPRSILCMPMHYRDNQTGILYLENTLTPNAFTNERLQVLELLLTQANISLENARLFDEVQALNTSLERKVEQRTAELRAVNRELEAFSYSVSHDLRGPLRNINGFSKMLLDRHKEALGESGQDLLRRIWRNTEKMSNLITGLLALSKVTRSEIKLETVDLAAIANAIIEDMQSQYPDQQINWICTEEAKVRGDHRLLYSALENLLNNAWKYSAKEKHPRIEFGVETEGDNRIYFVRDNGAGFNMRYAEKLFTSFQRLHSDKEFSGTGIGLATVQRIIHRHGGEVWAESEMHKGAIFYFTLGLQSQSAPAQ